ncbi:hypothetical protein DPMN_022630 [Dreissena polymorpha]|uniref:Uncharacterized protein n=1 Tax=Dreissena polymorpha TaxID=45954 RepID=A0A9D4NMT8_DREPO|nr:hypothetical protein DPMN_022630 [Dreissena polymorpha]
MKKNCHFSVLKCAVSPTGDRIYVTNYSHHKLITLAMDGKILSTFTGPELQYQLGVYVFFLGHVLVCGYTSCTIIQMDREVRKKLATLGAIKDRVMNPVSVCYNSDTHTVIVGQFSNELNVLEVQ